MQKKIFILRHGETDFNVRGIVQGSGIDSSLNDKGKLQAEAFYEFYKHEHFDIVLTSKLIRTHQTVNKFITEIENWEQFEDINEISWGIFEGKENGAMNDYYKLLIDSWQSGNLDAAVPEGESAKQLSDRLLRFIHHLRNRKEENILICTHGRTLRCLTALLLDLPPEEMERFSHYNTGLYTFSLKNGKFIMDLENDISHLENLGANDFI